jgi:peptidoglycan/xylan/chitin deacetylase (PgdA/CDA1 family)
MAAMKSIARHCFHHAGPLGLIRFLRRSGVRIIVYHRFPGATAALDEQCAHLLKYYRPVSLDDVASHLHEKKPLPSNAVAVTVDDGYRDFYVNAYEVFCKHGIPVTVFLTTDFLDRRAWLWWDRLKYMMERSKVQSIEVPHGVPPQVRLDLSSWSRRLHSLRFLKALLKELPDAERLEMLDRVQRSTRVEAPAEVTPEYEPLTWQEVRMMYSNRVSFGAHTRSHPILSRVSDHALVEEIEGSKIRLEQELQAAVTHFCYPNGRLHDIGSALNVVKKVGFKTAVTTEYGLNNSNTDPLLLKRIVVEPQMQAYWFEEVLCLVRMAAKGFARPGWPTELKITIRQPAAGNMP